MKNYFLMMLVALTILCSCKGANNATRQQADCGVLEYFEDFGSKFVPARDVLVWLPEKYDPQMKYAVLYMHDGQMLFDETISWNKQTWNVDAVASAVQRDGRCRPFIVVGIDNHPTNRLTEYMPARALEYLPQDDEVLRQFDRAEFIADGYLRFLVEELKPFIDSRYSTLTDRENTFVMGSSMGGLISLYALCEYPEVFGGAGCLSTHSPVAIDKIEAAAPAWSKAFRDYLSEHLPQPGTHRVYMDYGDQTIDAGYAPYQAALDSLFAARGWQTPHVVTRFFEGHAHDERSWQSRLHIPLEWLLGTK